MVQFEDMKRDAEGVFQDVCRFLGLDFEPSVLEEAYRPNTTFVGERKRNQVLSDADKRVIDLVMTVGKAIPVSVFRAAKRIAERRADKHLPVWFFSMYPPVFEERAKQGK